MGSFPSALASQAIAAALIVGVGVAIWLAKPVKPQPPKPSGKKGKKKKGAAASAVDGPSVDVEQRVPGGHPLIEREDEEQTSTTLPDEGVSTPVTPKPKAKKRKAKGATPSPAPGPSGSTSTSASAVAPSPAPSAQPLLTPDADGPWTRVETRRQRGTARAASSSDFPPLEGSEGGVTTSVTEEESGEPERKAGGDAGERRTLAERMLPKTRKTAVDDMLEDQTPEIARVMRVKPSAADKPAAGFSWGDYEDVEDAAAADADGEDDEGEWGIVKSKSRRPQSSTPSGSGTVPTLRQSKAPETLTKKQRQNARRRESEKASKADAEAERQAQLARHKREIEAQRMKEQFSSGGSGRGKPVSGGMRASVNDKGALVWE